MPSQARRERAKRLGLCIECVYNAVEPGVFKCRRCVRTRRLGYARRKDAQNLKRRLARANAALLQEWGRQLLLASLAGTPPPPQPAPVTWREPYWYYIDRLNPYQRRKPLGRYKYKPRAPSRSTPSCGKLDARTTDEDSETVESRVQPPMCPLAPSPEAPVSPPINTDNTGQGVTA